MADLELQRRKRPIWPWILGLLVLIALIWVAMDAMSDDDDLTDDDVLVTAPAPVDDQAYPVESGTAQSAEIQALRSACGSGSSLTEDMATDHSQAATCLTRLATALDATISRDTVGDQALTERLDVLQQRADQLTQNPQSTDHAIQLKEAMDEAAAVIEQVAESRTDISAELREHVSALNAAVDEFEGTELLLDQKRAAARYFDHAVEALELMNRNQEVQS